MSSADRDWYREADAGPRGWGGTPACWALIGVHVVVWALLTRVDAVGSLGSLALRLDDVVRHARVGELASYAFAWGEAAPLDLVWALACLLVFGREVEARAGAVRFLALYGVAILTVGIVALPWMAILDARGTISGGVGAAVAVLVAHATARPYATVLGVPVPLAAILLVAVPASQHLIVSVDTAWAAQLAGAVVGFVFAVRGLLVRGGRRPPMGADSAEGTPEAPAAPEPSGGVDMKGHVDALLAKIQREGLASLTKEEQAYLRRASRKFRD